MDDVEVHDVAIAIFTVVGVGPDVRRVSAGPNFCDVIVV